MAYIELFPAEDAECEVAVVDGGLVELESELSLGVLAVAAGQFHE